MFDYSAAKLVYMVAEGPEKILRPKDLYSTMRSLAGSVDDGTDIEAGVDHVMEQIAELYATDWAFEDDGVLYDTLESHIQYATTLLDTRSILHLPWSGNPNTD